MPASADEPTKPENSESCERAAIYADMARDARSPAERDELLARSRRYCPTATADADAPLDTY